MDINGDTKTLLIKDLSARIPYKVKCAYFDGMGNESVDILNAIFPNDERLLVGKCSIDYYESDILGVVPYLFPLSSMTEEQRKEYSNLLDEILDEFGHPAHFDTIESIDWLYGHHFDIHGLIPLGLAIDCTNLNIY